MNKILIYIIIGLFGFECSKPKQEQEIQRQKNVNAEETIERKTNNIVNTPSIDVNEMGIEDFLSFPIETQIQVFNAQSTDRKFALLRKLLPKFVWFDGLYGYHKYYDNGKLFIITQGYGGFAGVNNKVEIPYYLNTWKIDEKGMAYGKVDINGEFSVKLKNKILMSGNFPNGIILTEDPSLSPGLADVIGLNFESIILKKTEINGLETLWIGLESSKANRDAIVGTALPNDDPDTPFFRLDTNDLF